MKNYQEIVNELIKNLGWDRVKELVPFPTETLLEETEKDKGLKTIRLSLWECSTGFIEQNGTLIQVESRFRKALKEIGILSYTMPDAISILKEIASLIIEKEHQ